MNKRPANQHSPHTIVFGTNNKTLSTDTFVWPGGFYFVVFLGLRAQVATKVSTKPSRDDQGNTNDRPKVSKECENEAPELRTSAPIPYGLHKTA